ncbi:hypothetical protein ODZ84_17215 [Chryseobacterium fluminis]|uniref:hypothetical protein n=1 Tax=Chryseobacterium fluminis TaxID=2983606 RepID=UPI0022511167|nr:hypothetical protein [Chryseobacterium sp. MMS21-Ot14]UZT96942.1 hypothetical protein ODZ84_17215 [Chryseobacterium sp. MMS21-Ot14]
MLRNYLKLRIKLLLKAASQSMDIGALVTGIFLLLVFIKSDNSYWYGFISCAILFMVQFLRKDADFLKNILGKQFYISLVTEYLLIWAMTNLFFIFKTNDFLYLGSVALCFVLPFIKFRQHFNNAGFIYNIPVILLEWRSFIRKNTFALAGFFGVSFFLGYHPFTLVLLLAIWIYLLLIVYSYQESKELLILQFSKTGLEKKIMYSSVFCVIFSLPAVIGFVIMNPAEKMYPVFFILFIIVINHVIIIHKYMNFNEKVKENKANDMEFFKFLLMTASVVPALVFIFINKRTVAKKIAQYV